MVYSKWHCYEPLTIDHGDTSAQVCDATGAEGLSAAGYPIK